MIKKILKKKSSIVAICLCVLIMVNFALGVYFMPIRKVLAEGEIYEEIENLELGFDGFQEGEADQYLSNNDVSDEYIEEMYGYIEEIYYEYVSFDSEHIDFDMEYFVAIYGENFLDEETFDMSYLSEEETFEIATLRMINENISVMNELVDEGYGYINDDFEFVIFSEDEYVQQWKIWNFKLKWNKFTVNVDSDCAIVLSIITLALRTSFHGWNIHNTMNSLAADGDAMLVAVLQECFAVLPSDIASGIVGLFADPVISILANSFSILLTIAGNSSLFLKIITLIISITLPSIVDGVVVLYNACRYDKGAELKGCWIPWIGDKWGFSIKSI